MLKNIGRGISLISFLSIVLLILFYPYAFKSIVGTSRYGFMSFTLMICCLSFINGIGYTPESKYWRFITNPIFTITVLLLLLYGMFR